MRDDFKPIESSRRRFLKATALGSAAAVGLQSAAESSSQTPSASSSSPPNPSKLAAATPGALFDAGQRRALSAMAEIVLPGAGQWGASDYIENLLTCFDHDPPRLYAGTVGSTDEWLPLDRVRARAWRLRILGSEAVAHPGEPVTGPVRGWRPLLVEGAERAAAGLERGESSERLWRSMSEEFKETFTNLVLEGTLGDPIYGGNRDGAAWREFHFEGAMLGYGTYFGPPEGSAGDAHTGPHGGREHVPQGVGPSPLSLTTRIALWVLGFLSRRIA